MLSFRSQETLLHTFALVWQRQNKNWIYLKLVRIFWTLWNIFENISPIWKSWESNAQWSKIIKIDSFVGGFDLPVETVQQMTSCSTIDLCRRVGSQHIATTSVSRLACRTPCWYRETNKADHQWPSHHQGWLRQRNWGCWWWQPPHLGSMHTGPPPS